MNRKIKTKKLKKIYLIVERSRILNSHFQVFIILPIEASQSCQLKQKWKKVGFLPKKYCLRNISLKKCTKYYKLVKSTNIFLISLKPCNTDRKTQKMKICAEALFRVFVLSTCWNNCFALLSPKLFETLHFNIQFDTLTNITMIFKFLPQIRQHYDCIFNSKTQILMSNLFHWNKQLFYSEQFW